MRPWRRHLGQHRLSRSSNSTRAVRWGAGDQGVRCETGRRCKMSVSNNLRHVPADDPLRTSPQTIAVLGVTTGSSIRHRGVLRLAATGSDDPADLRASQPSPGRACPQRREHEVSTTLLLQCLRRPHRGCRGHPLGCRGGEVSTQEREDLGDSCVEQAAAAVAEPYLRPGASDNVLDLAETYSSA